MAAWLSCHIRTGGIDGESIYERRVVEYEATLTNPTTIATQSRIPGLTAATLGESLLKALSCPAVPYRLTIKHTVTLAPNSSRPNNQIHTLINSTDRRLVSHTASAA